MRDREQESREAGSRLRSRAEIEEPTELELLAEKTMAEMMGREPRGSLELMAREEAGRRYRAIGSEPTEERIELESRRILETWSREDEMRDATQWAEDLAEELGRVILEQTTEEAEMIERGRILELLETEAELEMIGAGLEAEKRELGADLEMSRLDLSQVRAERSRLEDEIEAELEGREPIEEEAEKRIERVELEEAEEEELEVFLEILEIGAGLEKTEKRIEEIESRLLDTIEKIEELEESSRREQEMSR